MSKKKQDPFAINWRARTEKRGNDSMIQGFMLPMLAQPATHIKCLSLPAAEWLWEQESARSFPQHRFDFIGVENNPRVHAAMMRHRDILNAESRRVRYAAMERQKLHTFLKSINTPFDIIYADYMGTWSAEKLAELETLFERRLLELHGYLVLTFSLMRDRGRFNKARQASLAFAKEASDIMVIDDHSIAKIKGSRTGNPEVQMRCRGIAQMVRCMAQEIAGMRLTPFPVHIYYNHFPHTGGFHPEASICLRRDK